MKYSELINLEWVHAAHTAEMGPVRATEGNKYWFERIRTHAEDCWRDKIKPTYGGRKPKAPTDRGLARIITANLY